MSLVAKVSIVASGFVALGLGDVAWYMYIHDGFISGYGSMLYMIMAGLPWLFFALGLSLLIPKKSVLSIAIVIVSDLVFLFLSVISFGAAIALTQRFGADTFWFGTWTRLIDGLGWGMLALSLVTLSIYGVTGRSENPAK